MRIVILRSDLRSLPGGPSVRPGAPRAAQAASSLYEYCVLSRWACRAGGGCQPFWRGWRPMSSSALIRLATTTQAIARARLASFARSSSVPWRAPCGPARLPGNDGRSSIRPGADLLRGGTGCVQPSAKAAAPSATLLHAAPPAVRRSVLLCPTPSFLGAAYYHGGLAVIPTCVVFRRLALAER
eukprot:scaffold279_cov369-Prasinococcus_capsulatus_cf.AAC.2